MQQGVDSRALFATFITKLPRLLVFAVAGAILGSGLNLFVVLVKAQHRCYVSETEYYVAFDKGQDDARHWYNDFTWNDVLATNGILGRAMELLGDGYERSQVKEMIRADILSDVRYLTITVKGQDAARVEAVKDALGTALEEFGAVQEEFSSIYKIEDLGIVQEEIPYFAWRSAFLGTFIASGIGVFVTAFCFCKKRYYGTSGDSCLWDDISGRMQQEREQFHGAVADKKAGSKLKNTDGERHAGSSDGCIQRAGGSSASAGDFGGWTD